MRSIFGVIGIVFGAFLFTGCSSMNTVTDSVVVLKECSRPKMTVMLGDFSVNDGQNRLVYTSDELKKALISSLGESKCILLAQSSEREKMVGKIYTLSAVVSSNIDSLISEGFIKDKKREHYVAKIGGKLVESDTGNATYTISSSGSFENSTTSYLGIGDSDKTDSARYKSLQKASKAIVKEIESIE